MASDLNRVLLIGRLVRDPELRYIQSGASVANFSIANNKSYTTSSGEKKENVSFINCIAWGKLGELVVEYCKKGRRIAIEGRLQQRSWVDKDENKRSTFEVVVDNVQFLDSKAATNETKSEDYPEVANSFPESSNFPKNDDNPFSDEEVPF